ncbi:hypothetical protein KCP73_00205 [Salmonella enterica subsp. enterica]|nr:hypothetical protein KCP73_00205 [Salmonella enterica subsp. enterica]
MLTANLPAVDWGIWSRFAASPPPPRLPALPPTSAGATSPHLGGNYAIPGHSGATGSGPLLIPSPRCRFPRWRRYC